MSWLYEDPDEWEPLASGETYGDYPGSIIKFDLHGIGRRKLDAEEAARAKARRLSDRDDAILAEADIIRAGRLEQEPRQEAGLQPNQQTQLDALMAELVTLRNEAASRDAPAWRANVQLSLTVERLLAPLQAIARMQLVTNNWTNASTLSSAVRLAQAALAELTPERTSPPAS